jgi:hypothetical protein
MTEAEPTKILVKRMASALDFEVLSSSALLHFAILSGSEAARAVAGELEAFLIDRAEVLADLEDDARLESDERAFAYVRRLEELGCVVLAGTDHVQSRFDDDPSRTRSYPIGCIAICLATEEPEFVTLDQGSASESEA